MSSDSKPLRAQTDEEPFCQRLEANALLKTYFFLLDSMPSQLKGRQILIQRWKQLRFQIFKKKKKKPPKDDDDGGELPR